MLTIIMNEEVKNSINNKEINFIFIRKRTIIQKKSNIKQKLLSIFIHLYIFYIIMV